MQLLQWAAAAKRFRHAIVAELRARGRDTQADRLLLPGMQGYPGTEELLSAVESEHCRELVHVESFSKLLLNQQAQTLPSLG